MSSETPDTTLGRRAGQAIFAFAFLGFAAFLLSQIGDQTKWAAKTAFFAQPRFWPAVSLGGMVLFTTLHLWKMPRKRRRISRTDKTEILIWASVLEYVLWFLAYVWLVPIIGYLPSTLLFMLALTWRLGYRRPRTLWISAGFAVLVVVGFKSFLQVKIPGGATYEYLPGAMRSFFILNF